MNDTDFHAAYERLSRTGACDSPGGMEYARVLREWHDSGRPTFLDQFIKVRANVMSDGSNRAQSN